MQKRNGTHSPTRHPSSPLPSRLAKASPDPEIRSCPHRAPPRPRLGSQTFDLSIMAARVWTQTDGGAQQLCTLPLAQRLPAEDPGNHFTACQHRPPTPISPVTRIFVRRPPRPSFFTQTTALATICATSSSLARLEHANPRAQPHVILPDNQTEIFSPLKQKSFRYSFQNPIHSLDLAPTYRELWSLSMP
jgi:hypothetical protein